MMARDPRDVYVEFWTDDSILRVALFPPDPTEGDWTVAVSPLSRRLDAGRTYRATLRVPIPAEPWNPYDEDDEPDRGADGRTVPATTLIFETRWFPEAGLRWSRPGPEEGTWWCTGSPTQVLGLEMPLDPAVPVAGVVPSAE